MAGYAGWSHSGKIDWDKVSTDAPKPLEPGVYLLEVAKAEPKETSQGHPSVAMAYQATKTWGGDSVKRKVFDNFVLTQDGAFKIKQFAEAVDADPPESVEYGTVSDWAEEVVGTEVWAYLVQQTYQGKTNNRVDRYLHTDDVEEFLEELNGGDKASKLNGRKDAKASAKVEAKASAQRNGRAAVETLSDEDEEEEEVKPRRGRPARR